MLEIQITLQHLRLNWWSGITRIGATEASLVYCTEIKQLAQGSSQAHFHHTYHVIEKPLTVTTTRFASIYLSLCTLWGRTDVIIIFITTIIILNLSGYEHWPEGFNWTCLMKCMEPGTRWRNRNQVWLVALFDKWAHYWNHQVNSRV